MKLKELPKNCKLHINMERNYRFMHNHFPFYIYASLDDAMEYVIDEIILKEKDFGITYNDELLFLKEECCQELLDDLYRAGFRPSDEVKKDELIKTLKNEIDKRDKMIDNLMNQFVFKDNAITGRKVIT